MKNWQAKIACALGALSLAASATVRADYLLDPSAGSVLFSSTTNHDDETSSQTLPFTLNFFGTNYTSLSVSTNGNLNLSSNPSYSDGPLSTNFAQIAPFWDDLYIDQGSGESISLLSNASYFAVTWNTAQYNGPAIREQFQAAIFGSTTTVKGFTFQPGDIAFSYTLLQTPFRGGQASLGLSKGDGSYVTLAAFAGSAGVVTTANAGSIPTAAGTFVLFRPNGSGSYVASVVNVPEPGTYALFALGGAALLVAGKLHHRADA